MTRLRFVQVDVFTDRPFTGDPLAVLPDARGLNDGQMQAIAQEMNLSPTTFVLPATDPRATYKSRIFTPTTGLPLAGHPSVGTLFILASEGLFRLEEPQTAIWLEVAIGTLPIERIVRMQGGAIFGLRLDDAGPLARALGIDPGEVTAPGRHPIDNAPLLGDDSLALLRGVPCPSISGDLMPSSIPPRLPSSGPPAT